MTILSALQSAAVRLIGRKPTTFFDAQGKFELELADLVNEVAADVQKYHDWQALVRVAVITGDGTSTDFPLPDGYDRMLVKTDLQDTQYWPWGYYPYQDINSFLFDEARNFQPYPGGWIIYNNRVRFVPAPFSAAEATFPYITSSAVRDTSTGAMKASFTADTDEWLLPERLLTLGLVWRWRENKGLATADQEAFTKALDEYAGKDAGSIILRRNGYATAGLRTHTAWPYSLGGNGYQIV